MAGNKVLPSSAGVTVGGSIMPDSAMEFLGLRVYLRRPRKVRVVANKIVNVDLHELPTGVRLGHRLHLLGKMLETSNAITKAPLRISSMVTGGWMYSCTNAR